jgi:hypothetical protein
MPVVGMASSTGNVTLYRLPTSDLAGVTESRDFTPRRVPQQFITSRSLRGQAATTLDRALHEARIMI